MDWLDLTGQSPGPVMWVTVHGDERAERMTDLTCVKLVNDAQAAAFPPVALWRATTSVPSADQCRLSGGLAQFSHEVLRKATHNAIALVAIIPVQYAPNSAIDTLSVRSMEVT